jgi:hypothetical protein
MSGSVPVLGAGRDNLACALCGVMMRCAGRDLTVLHSVTDCCATRYTVLSREVGNESCSFWISLFVVCGLLMLGEALF